MVMYRKNRVGKEEETVIRSEEKARWVKKGEMNAKERQRQSCKKRERERERERERGAKREGKVKTFRGGQREKCNSWE